MNKYIKIGIGIVISTFFLWLVVRDLHYADFLRAITTANVILLLIGLVVWLIGYAIRGVRARVLLLPIKNISWKRSMMYVLVGFTANNTLPLRAGEFVRPFIVGSKEDVSKTTVFATIAAERLFDGLALVLLTIIGASVMPIQPWMRNIIWFSAALFVVAFVGFLFLLHFNTHATKFIAKVLHLLPLQIRTKIESLLTVFTTGLEFLRNPTLLFGVASTSLAIWLCEAAFYYIAAKSFSFDVSFLQGMFVMGMLNLAILIPSSPGYVGTFEYVTVATLGLLGISHSAAAGYALVSHVVQFLAITIPGAVVWLRLGIGMNISNKNTDRHTASVMVSDGEQ